MIKEVRSKIIVIIMMMNNINTKNLKSKSKSKKKKKRKLDPVYVLEFLLTETKFIK